MRRLGADLRKEHIPLLNCAEDKSRGKQRMLWAETAARSRAGDLRLLA